MIVFVHAGLHKTGSTAIQSFLSLNRGLLAARGLYIPEAGAVGIGEADQWAHHNIAWEAGGYATSPDAGGLDDLVAELERERPPRACISSEVFATLYRQPEMLARVRSALLAIGAEVRVVLFFRPQASYLEGIYAELVKHGLAEPFDAFFERALVAGAVEYDDATYGLEYDRIADAFAEVFGRERLSLLPYRNSPRAEDVVERLLAIVAPEMHDLDLTRLGAWERRNLSVGFRGVARRLAENRSDGGDAGGALAELLPSARVSIDGPFRPLDTGRLARLFARFGDHNRILREKYGVDVPVWFVKRLVEQVRGEIAPDRSPAP